MKKLIVSSMIAGMILSSGSAFAGHGKWRNEGFNDTARVTQVQPIYRFVKVAVPHEECYTQEVRYDRHRDKKAAGTLLGGIIGGAVGHRIGHHDKGATIAGAIIGAAVGNSIAKDGRRHQEVVKYEDVCETHTRYRKERQIDGYEVTYRYRGEYFTTRMDERPGKRIPIRVHVSPVGY